MPCPQGYGGPVHAVQPAGHLPGVGGQREQDHVRHGGPPRQLEDPTERHQHGMEEDPHIISLFLDPSQNLVLLHARGEVR